MNRAPGIAPGVIFFKTVSKIFWVQKQKTYLINIGNTKPINTKDYDMTRINISGIQLGGMGAITPRRQSAFDDDEKVEITDEKVALAEQWMAFSRNEQNELEKAVVVKKVKSNKDILEILSWIMSENGIGVRNAFIREGKDENIFMEYDGEIHFFDKDRAGVHSDDDDYVPLSGPDIGTAHDRVNLLERKTRFLKMLNEFLEKEAGR